MDLFSEVGLDMKVDISSLATQSQSTAPTSIRVIASPPNPSSPNFRPQSMSHVLSKQMEAGKKNGGAKGEKDNKEENEDEEVEEEGNGWEDDDLDDLWSVCGKQSIRRDTTYT